MDGDLKGQHIERLVTSGQGALVYFDFKFKNFFGVAYPPVYLTFSKPKRVCHRAIFFLKSPQI
jgi:hypothetical protein